MSNVVQQKWMTHSPVEYAAAAVLANAVAEQMLSRLEWVLWQPKVIVDVGCGTGYGRELLKQRYPEAQILAIDTAYPMLHYAKQQAKNRQEGFLSADAMTLPFKNQSVDLLFANFMMPWHSNFEKLLQEWRRVLRPEGLLMFTSLGPDTLQTWRESLGDSIMPDLIDMHHIGDALTQLKFVEPVLDVEHFTLTYKDQHKLFHELQASGMILPGDYQECMKNTKNLRNETGVFETIYEVVYGHAWMPEDVREQAADEDGVVKFPLSYLRQR